MKLIVNEWFWFLDPCKNEFNYCRRNKVKLYVTRFNKFKCKPEYEIAEARATESAPGCLFQCFFWRDLCISQVSQRCDIHVLHTFDIHVLLGSKYKTKALLTVFL